MKFGKSLLRESVQGNPEWAPFWLDYKHLKMRIKAVIRAAHHATNQRDISDSKLEVNFFRDLQVELKKISLFYAAKEKRCCVRLRQLRSLHKSLQKQSKIETFELLRLLFAFVHFYRNCIRLENYAVINYQGFSKILKKHDKVTGYNTRSKYMRRKVNLSSFSGYPNLLHVLSSTEDMFYEVERDICMMSAVSVQTVATNPGSTRASIPVAHFPTISSKPSYTSPVPVRLPSLFLA